MPNIQPAAYIHYMYVYSSSQNSVPVIQLWCSVVHSRVMQSSGTERVTKCTLLPLISAHMRVV